MAESWLKISLAWLASGKSHLYPIVSDDDVVLRLLVVTIHFVVLMGLVVEIFGVVEVEIG